MIFPLTTEPCPSVGAPTARFSERVKSAAFRHRPNRFIVFLFFMLFLSFVDDWRPVLTRVVFDIVLPFTSFNRNRAQTLQPKSRNALKPRRDGGP